MRWILAALFAGFLAGCAARYQGWGPPDWEPVPTNRPWMVVTNDVAEEPAYVPNAP